MSKPATTRKPANIVYGLEDTPPMLVTVMNLSLIHI